MRPTPVAQFSHAHANRPVELLDCGINPWRCITTGGTKERELAPPPLRPDWLSLLLAAFCLVVGWSLAALRFLLRPARAHALALVCFYIFDAILLGLTT